VVPVGVGMHTQEVLRFVRFLSWSEGKLIFTSYCYCYYPTTEDKLAIRFSKLIICD
jgi:hypothetical protein